jgi:acyl-CoA synthetase (AMP-forming)/AMP-acid ligase II
MPAGDVLLAADTLWALLARRASVSPTSTLLIDAPTGRTLTVAQFRDRALDYARWLHGIGIGPDSTVAWQLPTCIEAALLCFALIRLGALQAPVIHLYRARELREVVQQSRPQFLLTFKAASGAECPEHVSAALEQVQSPPRVVIPSDYRLMSEVDLPPEPDVRTAVRWHYYTSGTTSRPKGAKHTDRSLIFAGRGLAGILGMGPRDVGTIAYPFAHIGGIAYLSAALASGMAVVLFDRFVPSEVVQAFRRYRVTFSGGSTAHYQALLAEQRRNPAAEFAPTLKVLAGGGASKPAPLYQQVKQELGCTIVHAYGLTEAPITTSNAPDDTDEHLAHTDGVPLNGMEIRIRRSDSTLADVGESGEIMLRGPNLCSGYLDPEHNREAFDAEGFFRTGDLGLMRPDGRLCVTGRIKDVIIRKGENISALEIEELLLEHPKVGEVAVIGLPDEERGERVCAVVVTRRPGDLLSFAEMQQFLTSRQLMRQKIPEQLEIVDGLPRTEGLQKVLKKQLREQIMNGCYGHVLVSE